MSIVHLKADIFAQESGILIHACNTKGSWGAGIAVPFKERFPDAFDVYNAHCAKHGSKLIGTCLLIPRENVDIACLFTSRAYGKRKDSEKEILAATKTAVQDLVSQNVEGKILHACRFNSGKFGVPWEKTEEVLVEIGASMRVYEAVVPVQ